MSILVDLLGALDTAMQNEAQSTAVRLAAGMWQVMNAVAGLVLIYKVIMITVGEFNLKWFVGFIFATTVGGFFISYPAIYYDYVIDPARSFIFGTAGQIIGSGGGTGTSSLATLASAVEDNMYKAVKAGVLIMEDAGFKLHWHLAALVLILPYVISVIIFGIYIVYALGLLLVPYALGPIFVFASLWPWSRRVAIGAVNMLLSAAGHIIFSTLILKLSSATSEKILSLIPGTDGGELPASAGQFLFSNEFWAGVIMGWVSLYLLLKVPSLVSYVSMSHDASSVRLGTPSLPAARGAAQPSSPPSTPRAAPSLPAARGAAQPTSKG